MGNTYKDHSRRLWATAGSLEPSFEALNLGCLQRIADATELAAKNHDHPIVEAKIWNRTTKAFDIKSGRFHGYGFDFEEFENGAVQVSIAIVELGDGTVAMPRADNIRFLTPQA